MPSTSSHPARHSTMTSRATAVISPTIRSLYRVPTSLWDEKLFFANTSFKNEGFLQSALQHLREAPVHSVNDLVRLTFYWSPCYWTYDDLDLLAVRSNFPVKKELLVSVRLSACSDTALGLIQVCTLHVHGQRRGRQFGEGDGRGGDVGRGERRWSKHE